MKLELEPVVKQDSEFSVSLDKPASISNNDPWVQEPDPENINGKKAENPWIGKFERRAKSRDAIHIDFVL